MQKSYSLGISLTRNDWLPVMNHYRPFLGIGSGHSE
jgi:hypothetical protein